MGGEYAFKPFGISRRFRFRQVCKLNPNAGDHLIIVAEGAVVQKLERQRVKWHTWLEETVENGSTFMSCEFVKRRNWRKFLFHGALGTDVREDYSLEERTAFYS